MKLLKKLVMLTVVFTSLFMFSACGGGSKEANVEGTLEEIMEKVYAGVYELPEDSKPMLMNMPVDGSDVDAMTYYLGSGYVEFKEDLAC